jgi:drug/metabolite transporter (DMT)-like permease
LGESSELAGILSWRMQSEYWLLALPSIACNAMANLLFVRALQLSDLSLTIPYLSLTPVMAVFSGWLVVGEQPALVGIAGVAVIAIGALVLNPSAAGEFGFHPIRALKEERGSLAMLGVACLWSVSVAFDKRALDYSSPMTHAAVLAVTGWLILDAFRRRRSSASMVERTRPVFGLLMGTTLVITVALLAQLWAYHYVNVAYVEAIKRSLGMVGSVLIGWWFFNEASVGRRIAAVAAMAVGVCLILLGG